MWMLYEDDREIKIYEDSHTAVETAVALNRRELLNRGDKVYHIKEILYDEDKVS